MDRDCSSPAGSSARPGDTATCGRARTIWLIARPAPAACASARVADGVDGVRKAAREELLMGADQIKIMASGGVASPTDPVGAWGYSEDEIRAIVEEARARATYVLAHAYTAEAISRVVRCGVRIIEHGNLVDLPTARLMAEKGAYAVPTLVTYEALARAPNTACLRKAWPRSPTCVTPACARLGFFGKPA
jgi:imidazolonepropionase-like amidohydrolase